MLEGRPARPVATAQVGNASVLQSPTQRSARVVPPGPRLTVPQPAYTNYAPRPAAYRTQAPPMYVPPQPLRYPPRQMAYQPPAVGRTHLATLSLLLGVVAALMALFIMNATHSAGAIRGLRWPVHPIIALSGAFPQGTLNHISFLLLLACAIPALLAIFVGRSARRRVLLSGKRLRGGALAFFGRSLGALSLLALALILLVAR